MTNKAQNLNVMIVSSLTLREAWYRSLPEWSIFGSIARFLVSTRRPAHPQRLLAWLSTCPHRRQTSNTTWKVFFRHVLTTCTENCFQYATAPENRFFKFIKSFKNSILKSKGLTEHPQQGCCFENSWTLRNSIHAIVVSDMKVRERHWTAVAILVFVLLGHKLHY